MASFILGNCPLFETFSGVNVTEVLTSALLEWETEKTNDGIAECDKHGYRRQM